MNNEMVVAEKVQQDENFSLIKHGMRLEDFQAMIKQMQTLVQKHMVEGVDYGTIPGCGEKKSLLQPGAEKALQLWNLTKRFHIIEKVISKEFISIDVKCIVAPMGKPHLIIAECIANCNSQEEKYAANWFTEKKLPDPSIKHTLKKKEKTGSYGKFFVYRIPKESAYNDYNTILKMSQKRAMVGAAKLATNCSDQFLDEAEKTSSRGEKKLTVPQIKRMFTIAKKNNWPDEQIKTEIMTRFNKEHSEDLTRSEYDELCKIFATPLAMKDTALDESGLDVD